MKPLSRRPRSWYGRLFGPRPNDVGWTSGLVVGLLVGCSSTVDPASGDPRLDLRHADPRVRIDAARQAVSESRTDLCGLLVRNLSDRDGAVRLFSSVALRKLTGQDFDFKAHGTLTERQESIERWTRWLEAEGLIARDAGRVDPPPEDASSAREDADADGEADADEDSPGTDEALPRLPPPVPLNSATGNPVENAAPRAKISDENADDRWVGTTSKAVRS